MDIHSLMKEYMDECDKRSRNITGTKLPSILNEDHHLPLVPKKSEWQIADGPERLTRLFSFKTLQQRALFVEYLFEMEEKTNHSAKITIEGLDVTVEIWTHDLNKVTELDKEYANSCDEMYEDVILVRFLEDERF